jgi:uncharacterized membrane protein
VALLLAAGGGFGLALGTHALVADDTAFLIQNRAPAATRTHLLSFGTIFALALAAVPLVGYAAGRHSAWRLREIGLRLSPLLPISLAWLLLDATAWAEDRLAHLIGVTGVFVIAFTCLRARAAAEPLALERHLAAWLRPVLARIAGASPHLPLLLILLGATAYTLWFSQVTLAAHWNGQTHSHDLGIFDNLMWNVVHGEGFLRSTMAGGGEHSHFGRHATLFAFALAPVYALHSSAATLLVLQSLFIGFAAVPLFLFARAHVGAWPACGIAVAYLLYAPAHGSNLCDFHFLAIAPFFLFCTAHALETSSRTWLVLSVVLALSVREELGLCVAVLGAYHVIAKRRAAAGLTLLVAGLACFLALKFWLMPLALSGTSGFADIYKGLIPGLVPERSGRFSAVLETLLVNPAFVLGTLVREAKLEYALLIFAPLAFLPLRPVGVWPLLLPGFLFTLLSTDYPPVVSIGYQYTAFWTPFVFVAATLALREDGFAAPDGATTRRAWAAGFALLTLLCSYQYGAVFQQGTAAGGVHTPFPFTTTEVDLERRRQRADLLAGIPPDARVAASENVAPHVSNRKVAYTMREGVLDAEYVVLELSPRADEEIAVAQTLLRSSHFGVVAMNKGFALLRRGAPSTLNQRLLRRLHAIASEAPS